jgi:hypothetical protein
MNPIRFFRLHPERGDKKRQHKVGTSLEQNPIHIEINPGLEDKRGNLVGVALKRDLWG